MRKKYSDPLIFSTIMLTSFEGGGSNHGTAPTPGDDEIITSNSPLMMNDMMAAPQEEIIGSEVDGTDALTIVEPSADPITEETISDVLDTIVPGDDSAEETDVMP